MDAVSEFDDKLNALLSDPGKMAQIMQMAQSISGGEDSPSNGPSSAASPPPQQTVSHAPPPAAGTDLLSSLGSGLDPKLLMRLLPLIQELGGQRDSNARALLYALRPYLKPERQERWSGHCSLPGCSIWAKSSWLVGRGEPCITAMSATITAPTPASRRNPRPLLPPGAKRTLTTNTIHPIHPMTDLPGRPNQAGIKAGPPAIHRLRQAPPAAPFPMD